MKTQREEIEKGNKSMIGTTQTPTDYLELTVNEFEEFIDNKLVALFKHNLEGYELRIRQIQCNHHRNPTQPSKWKVKQVLNLETLTRVVVTIKQGEQKD